MRPRKKVLLLVPDELQMSHWRMRLDLRGYTVLSAADLFEALELTSTNPDCLLAATTVPGQLGADGLRALAPHIEALLLFGIPVLPGATMAHRVELDGPALVERVLFTVRLLAARKRGPKPPRELARELQPTLRTLLEERDVGMAAA